jgi:hypothetical protein
MVKGGCVITGGKERERERERERLEFHNTL